MSWPHSDRWRGMTAVCLASGTSMRQEDADLLQEFPVNVVTVNSTYKMAPWADVHYSSDHDWWDVNIAEMRQSCSGEFWTGHPTYVQPDVHRCPYDKRGRGLSTRPGVITWGGNSGYCAIGLAWQFGARRVLLVGYDQQGNGHWHPDHPDSIKKDFNWPMWHERFNELAADAPRHGLQILNCSRETALTCFERVPLEEALCSRF